MIDISELVSTKGKSLELELQPEATEIIISRDSFPITEHKPFKLSLKNDENKHLCISGSTQLTVEIPCDRCLGATHESFELELERVLPIEEGGIVKSDDPDEELTFVQEHELDPQQLLYDEILVNWPTKVLCQENCKGICFLCGANLNEQDCKCDRQVIDPRMAKFQDIFDQFKEV